MSTEKIPKCIGVRLRTLNDLARFASAMATLGHGTYIIHFEKNGKHIYGIYAVFRDYYKFYGLPLFYYIELEEALNGQYLIVHADERGENIEVSRGTRPGRVSIPIIDLKAAPNIVDA